MRGFHSSRDECSLRLFRAVGQTSAFAELGILPDIGMQDVELPPDRQEMPASKKAKHYKGSVNLRHVIGNMKLKA